MKNVLTSLSAYLTTASSAPVYIEAPPATEDIFQTLSVESWIEPVPGLWKATFVFHAYAPTMPQALKQAELLKQALSELIGFDAYSKVNIANIIPAPMLDGERKAAQVLADLAGYK